EEPCELRTALHQMIEELIRADGVDVLAGIAPRYAERQLLFFQNLHRPHSSLISTLATAEISSFLEAFNADGRVEVLHPQHLIGKLLIDKSTVGKGREYAVRMRFTQAEQIVLAYHRFTAGVEEHIGSQFIGLIDDVIQFLIAQIQLITVFCRPTAGAMKVAGGSGVQQDCPGAIASVRFTISRLLAAA